MKAPKVGWERDEDGVYAEAIGLWFIHADCLAMGNELWDSRLSFSDRLRYL